MSSIDSSCPEDANSTDCLLRTLLRLFDEQAKADKAEAAKYDWDPITFGFTVPVGILAAALALVTVYLTVVVAGPGRRRSSARAIGMWSKNTRRKWDWQGPLRTTEAVTPVVTISGVSSVLKKKTAAVAGPSQEGAAGSQQEMTGLYQTVAGLRQTVAGLRQTVAGLIQMREKYDTILGASWLDFLDKVGLSYDELKDGERKTTAADYLPGDVLAVPAYGEVGFIITAAACAGVYSWRPGAQPPYPVIIGHDFQFDFYQHPTLSTVGAFSWYGSRDPRPLPSSSQQQHKWLQMRRAFQHASGDVAVGGLLPLMASTQHESVNAINRSSPESLLIAGHGDGSCGNSGWPCSESSLFSRHDDHHLLWLLIGDSPASPPAIFPSRASRERNMLSVLALSSKLWAGAWQEQDNNNNSFRDIVPGIQWSSNADLPPDISDSYLTYLSLMLMKKSDRPHDWSGAHNRSYANVLDPVVLDDPGQVLGLPHILQASLRLLSSYKEFQAWVDGLNSLRKSVFRSLVLLQLQQLDGWLKRQGHRAVWCRATALFLTTATLLDVEKALAEKTFNLSESYKGRLSFEQRDEHEPRSHAVARHLDLLKALEQLTDKDDPETPIGRGVTESMVPSIRKADLQDFTSYSTSGLLQLAVMGDYPHRPLPLMALKRAVSPVLQNYRDIWGLAAPTGRAGGTIEGIIDRVLVWRCLLMAMLF
jgi:hypothetical protein